MAVGEKVADERSHQSSWGDGKRQKGTPGENNWGQTWDGTVEMERSGQVADKSL